MGGRILGALAVDLGGGIVEDFRVGLGGLAGGSWGALGGPWGPLGVDFGGLIGGS